MNRWLKLLVLPLIPGQLLAQPLTIQDISPEDQTKLQVELPELFTGRHPSLSDLDQAITVLMKTGHYENIFIERSNSQEISLTGKPLRLVDEVEVIGVHAVSMSDIQNLLTVKKGDRFDRKKAVSMAENIKTFYSNSGYFDAIVELSFDKTPRKMMRLKVAITEGTPCIVKGLIFETANIDLKARLDEHYGRNIGQPLKVEDTQQMTSDLGKFLIQNRYLASEVIGPTPRYNADKTEVYLQYEIREPFRWEFFFEGEEFLTTTEIYRALDLKNTERKSLEPASEGGERIRRAYLEKGFPNAQVLTQVIHPKGLYLKRVYYTIQEGARVKIREINVQGRLSRKSSYYEDFIFRNSTPLIRSRFFNRNDLDRGFKNLVTDLRNQGFPRARVLSSRVEYNERRTDAIVYVMLDEGPQTQIRALDFDGNKFFSSFELSQVTGLETNSPLRLNVFEESLEKLKSFYLNQGFLEMRILNEHDDIIQYNEQGTQAHVVYRIFEGPRVRINSIVVDGNTFTKSKVIRQEADFKIGEILTPEKIEDATIRLNRMGIFARAHIHTLEEGTNVAERTLIISVVESEPGTFKFGGGVNNDRGLTVRGFTGLSYNNLWGTGRAISGRVEVKSNIAEVNYPENEIAAGYTEPFIFNTRTKGRVNLSRAERVFEYNASDEDTRITTSNRLDFWADRDLTRDIKLSWKLWSLETYREFERYGRCIPDDPSAPLDPGHCPPKTMQIATLGPTLDFDYRDNPFLPTQGSFTRFVIDYSSPGLGSSEGVDFWRSEMNYTKYTPVTSLNWVWANSVRGGYVRNLSDKEGSGVPTSYAFLLGGIYTVRGFDSSSGSERIPPDTDTFKVARRTQKLIEKDSYYYLFKSEIRFPIYQNWGGVVFYDGAAVFITGQEFERHYHDAVGFGIRYNTPVGPAAADLAFKIDPLPGEKKSGRIYISIGTF